MKRTAVCSLALALLLVGVSAFAADRDALQGTWAVSLGIYTDGTQEKELDMQFSFMKTTMTNPMSDGEIPYTLDEKAKTITAKSGTDTVWIHYTLVDRATLKFIEMKVTTPKGVTLIVGDKGTFKELDLARKQ